MQEQMRVNFSVGTGRNERIDEVASLSRTVEESGFSAITFVDQQNLSRDQYVMMTIAALNTHRIRIGHGVTQAYTYHPSVLANATASVDELSGGRAFIGIGAGGNNLRSMGQKAPPMKAYRDSVEFLRKYLRGEEAEYEGSKMRSDWVNRQIPIYMAADGERALQLAGELADGIMFIGVHPEIVKWRMEQIEKGAARVGRDHTKIDIWARTHVYVSETKEAAAYEGASIAATCVRMVNSYLMRGDPGSKELAARLERAEPDITGDFRLIHSGWKEEDHERIGAEHGKLVTPRVMDFFNLMGPADEICERIEQLHNLGVKTISALTLTTIDKKGMIREIGDKILPRFRN